MWELQENSTRSLCCIFILFIQKMVATSDDGEKSKLEVSCYRLKSLELDNRTTLILSNTRELNRDFFTK